MRLCISMCVSARVGSPVCTDSLNKHKKYLKSFSFPVYVCACVFGMTTTRTSLKIPPLHVLSIWLFDPNYRMVLYCCSLACQIGNIAVVAVIMCSLLCLCTGCSSKYSARSCGTMLALTVCTVAFDPCQDVKASVVLRYRFDS